MTMIPTWIQWTVCSTGWRLTGTLMSSPKVPTQHLHMVLTLPTPRPLPPISPAPILCSSSSNSNSSSSSMTPTAALSSSSNSSSSSNNSLTPMAALSSNNNNSSSNNSLTPMAALSSSSNSSSSRQTPTKHLPTRPPPMATPCIEREAFRQSLSLSRRSKISSRNSWQSSGQPTPQLLSVNFKQVSRED